MLKHIYHGRQNIYALVKSQNITYYAWRMRGCDPENQKWLTIGYNDREVRDRATKEMALYAPAAKEVLEARQEEREAEEKVYLN